MLKSLRPWKKVSKTLKEYTNRQLNSAGALERKVTAQNENLSRKLRFGGKTERHIESENSKNLIENLAESIRCAVSFTIGHNHL